MTPSSNRRSWNGEPVVLFVEGYSDLRFYAEMMEHLGLFDGCFIQDLGGNGRAKLVNQLKLLLKPDNLEQIKAVLILLDSDQEAGAAFRSAQGALQDALGVDVPGPEQWHQHGGTRFGIYVAGIKSGQAEIESLAWEAWSSEAENAGLKDCVETFLGCAESAGSRLKSPDKVRVGTVLAVLNEDDPRLGPGAQNRVFDFDSPAFDGLRTFLNGIKPIA